jgi:pimeloyl-ACP methyl ester carboxylesterase
MKRVATLLVAGVVGLYALACAAGRLGYRTLLYPAPQRDDVAAPAGGSVRELRAADGVPVRAVDVPNPGAARTVVYFHGNGEVVGDDLWMAQRLHAAGFGVSLVEYRGYGRSHDAGSPTEEGLYADATAVLDDLAARGVGADKVILWGISLGSGVAVEMAKRGRGAALVLVAPYTSIPDMAARVTPWLPVRWLVGDKFDSVAKGPALALPTVVVHGTDDEVIPFAMGERMAQVIPGARFEPIPTAHHMDCFLVDEGLLGRVTARVRGR